MNSAPSIHAVVPADPISAQMQQTMIAPRSFGVRKGDVILFRVPRAPFERTVFEVAPAPLSGECAGQFDCVYLEPLARGGK